MSDTPDVVLSPRKQLESGVLPEDITCRDNLVLVIRTNGAIACVTEKTVQKTGWKIIENNILPVEVITTPLTIEKVQDEIIELRVASTVKFVDDGREIKRSMVQGAPAPMPYYERIMDGIENGLSADADGLARTLVIPHEKYSTHASGFYAIDWMPTYIPDGQKLLFSETSCYESGRCLLGITFVPTTFVLNQNVINFDLQISKGFSIGVEYNPNGLDEIEDVIEHAKEVFESQPGNYGGFREMTRDGKIVDAYAGGTTLNHYQAAIGFHPDDFTIIHVNSNYHTLDELIPIFESIME